jgi:dihydroorotate dehydrogenase (NAD+) catalytic subunit
MVWEVASAVSLPIIGAGGIGSATDALEFIIAGAQAVAVASAVIDRPTVVEEICAGLQDYLRRHNVRSISELVGTLRT